jgi:hypothetical protein
MVLPVESENEECMVESDMIDMDADAIEPFGEGERALKNSFRG